MAFLLFELTVGMFYPSYGSIKSQNIPEEVRSGVMNIFRIPLNGTHYALTSLGGLLWTLCVFCVPLNGASLWGRAWVLACLGGLCLFKLSFTEALCLKHPPQRCESLVGA